MGRWLHRVVRRFRYSVKNSKGQQFLDPRVYETGPRHVIIRVACVCQNDDNSVRVGICVDKRVGAEVFVTPSEYPFLIVVGPIEMTGLKSCFTLGGERMWPA